MDKFPHMETSMSKRVEKRGHDQSVEDAAAVHIPDSKKLKQPALARYERPLFKLSSFKWYS